MRTTSRDPHECSTSTAEPASRIVPVEPFRLTVCKQRAVSLLRSCQTIYPTVFSVSNRVAPSSVHIMSGAEKGLASDLRFSTPNLEPLPTTTVVNGTRHCVAANCQAGSVKKASRSSFRLDPYSTNPRSRCFQLRYSAFTSTGRQLIGALTRCGERMVP